MSVNDLIKALSPEQLYLLTKDIKTLPRNRVISVDTSHRERRNNKTELYFKAVPRASMFQNHDTYSDHAECIRQQVISGVDL
jgi:hypothetical protein